MPLASAGKVRIAAVAIKTKIAVATATVAAVTIAAGSGIRADIRRPRSSAGATASSSC